MGAISAYTNSHANHEENIGSMNIENEDVVDADRLNDEDDDDVLIVN